MQLQERKSGVTFKPVTNVRFAVSHDERTDLLDAEYLLPSQYRLGNLVIPGSMSENDIADLHITRTANMSGQAKAKGAAAFWEGVAVLPAIFSGPADDYLRKNETNLKKLAREMQQKYGFTVLHMSIHLDEGKYDKETGDVFYNPHAHIIIDRSLKNGKLWTPNKTALAGFQSLAADCLEMKRGLTVYDRGGKPSRKNVDHTTFRALHDEFENASEFEKQLAALGAENAMLRAQNKAAKTSLAGAEENRLYDVFRAFLKGTGKAKQKDYQRLKKLFKYERANFNALCEIIDLSDNPDADEIFWRLRGDDLELLREAKGENKGAIAAKSGMYGPSLPADLTIDPFIRWNPNGEDLYLLPERDEKRGRLAFRDVGDRINLRLNDDKTIIAALMVARKKWPEGPIVVSGDADFVKRCVVLGLQHKIPVQFKTEPGAPGAEAPPHESAKLLDPRSGPSGPRR